MKRLAITLLLTLLFAAAALSQTNLKVGAEAPLFSAASLDGSCYDLRDLRGSVVVLTFWSTKCPICQHEFPKLNRVVDSFQGKKVVFLSLTLENEAKVESYLRSNHLASQILPNSFGVLLQYADRSKNGNLDMGFPSYFVIDQDGRLQYRSSGFDKTDSLNAAVSRLASK
jgi:peroxiredoxin